MSQVQLTTLGKSCEFFNGKAHEKSIDENGKYIVVNSKFISSEGKSFKRTNEQMFPLYKGDIVMVMSDVPNGKALAKCFVIDKEDTYSLNQRICCIRSKEFDTKYLYYQLNRHEHFLAFNNGENQTNLRKDDILDCPLIQPSMEEQKRIVAELDEAILKISNAINNCEININNSLELFKSEIDKLFLNKNDKWSESKIGDLLLKTETIDPRKTPNKQFIYLDVSSVNKESKQIEEPTTLFGVNAPSRARKVIKTNDVIFATVRPTHARVAIIPDEFNNQVCSTGYFVMRAKSVLNPSMLFYYTLTTQFNKEMESKQRGASYPAVTDNDIKELVITYPRNIDEQDALIEKLDLLYIHSNDLCKKYQLKIEYLEELKFRVLRRVFENELIEVE